MIKLDLEAPQMRRAVVPKLIRAVVPFALTVVLHDLFFLAGSADIV